MGYHIVNRDGPVKSMEEAVRAAVRTAHKNGDIDNFFIRKEHGGMVGAMTGGQDGHWEGQIITDGRLIADDTFMEYWDGGECSLDSLDISTSSPIFTGRDGEIDPTLEWFEDAIDAAEIAAEEMRKINQAQ